MGEENGNPLLYSCLGSHGQRSLAGYNSWDHNEMEMTYPLSTHMMNKSASQCIFGEQVNSMRTLLYILERPGEQV